jgi:hypothetical protein
MRYVLYYTVLVMPHTELNIDVIDDLVSEAKEVHHANPWFTYCEPMQRLRESGLSLKELDLLDERQLPPDLMRAVCGIL